MKNWGQWELCIKAQAGKGEQFALNRVSAASRWPIFRTASEPGSLALLAG